jgi:glycosyltransferase involved in cell wall biosynthesis
LRQAPSRSGGTERAVVKILMLGWEMPPHVSGGLGTACHGMTAALSRLGAEVTFVAPRPAGASGAGSSRRGIETVAVSAAASPYGSRGGRGSGLYGATLLEDVARYAEAAEGIARRGGFDVVHAHDWLTYPAGIAASRAARRPLVVHVHATEHDRSPGAPDPRIAALEQQGVDAAARVVCVSRYASEVLARHYRVEAAKVRVVHNGVTPPRASRLSRRRPGRGRTVLFLGRVTAQKAPGVLLDAAARVLAALPETTFVVAGTGDLLPWAIERAARLRIARRVRFPGFLRGRGVARALAEADAFVLPSVSEPFGIAPLEAMSMGVPTIVSSRSGVREVVRHALVVEPGDALDLASKVIAVLSRPGLARSLAVHGRAEARRLRWDEPATRLLDVYRETRGGAR